MNEPFTTESDVEHRVITHANGDRTIVDISVTEEQATQLAQLSGDELNAAIAEHKAEADRKAEAEKTAEATQAVVNDPPKVGSDQAATSSPLDPAPAGPSPVQAGSGVADVPYTQPVPTPDSPNAPAVDTTAEGSGSSGFPVA
jgi:hypothetical protein